MPGAWFDKLTMREVVWLHANRERRGIRLPAILNLPHGELVEPRMSAQATAARDNNGSAHRLERIADHLGHAVNRRAHHPRIAPQHDIR